MMIAKGILERPKTPYFYFQEYKKVKEPKGHYCPTFGGFSDFARKQ